MTYPIKSNLTVFNVICVNEPADPEPERRIWIYLSDTSGLSSRWCTVCGVPYFNIPGVHISTDLARALVLISFPVRQDVTVDQFTYDGL